MRGENQPQEQRGNPLVWIAADYHFPSTYSCRIPMSSDRSTLAMPTPGPATIRLALIRTGIEFFGLERTREELFPAVRAMTVRVRPPAQVALSQQILRTYKWSGRGRNLTLQESITTREMAQASGLMTVYLQVPAFAEQLMRTLFQMIGYWGQSSSLASCLRITQTPPLPGECATPLVSLDPSLPLQPYFSCLVTEFASRHLL